MSTQPAIPVATTAHNADESDDGISWQAGTQLTNEATQVGEADEDTVLDLSLKNDPKCTDVTVKQPTPMTSLPHGLKMPAESDASGSSSSDDNNMNIGRIQDPATRFFKTPEPSTGGTLTKMNQEYIDAPDHLSHPVASGDPSDSVSAADTHGILTVIKQEDLVFDAPDQRLYPVASGDPLDPESTARPEKRPQKRSQKSIEELKEELYLEQRRKNNEAAKRSRDSQRQKATSTESRVADLEKEHLQLQTTVVMLRQENDSLKQMLADDI
jgi:hypothetical protein